jgi:hypothetical protein
MPWDTIAGYPASFYDIHERDWYDATGELHPTGHKHGEAFKPIYTRRSDGARGWFPQTGYGFKPFAE